MPFRDNVAAAKALREHALDSVGWLAANLSESQITELEDRLFPAPDPEGVLVVLRQHMRTLMVQGFDKSDPTVKHLAQRINALSGG